MRVAMATRRQNWGEDRVTFYDDDGRLRSMPSSWTDVDPPDIFAQASGGRSHLRVDDLAELVRVIEGVEEGRRWPGSVK